jgi:hypothetical protein
MAGARRIARNARRFCLCVLAALTASCSAMEPSGAEDIKVIDSPIVAYPIAWMDDERILMRKDTGETSARPNGARIALFHWVSYNYKTGEIQDHGPVGTKPCYTSGYVSHFMHDDVDDEHLIAVYGELGKETRRRVKPGELWFEGGARGSCRPVSEGPTRPSWARADSAIWFLWPRLGVIDCQTRQVSPLANHIKARFHRLGAEQGVELPFSCEEVSGYDRLRYYPFKGAYFAIEYDYRHPWPENRNRRAFWLYPDGHVETLTFPYSQAIRNYAIPVHDGILAFSRPANRKDDYWVYYLTPNSTKRLYRGNATGITSPDGCKVAMLLDPDFKAKVRSRDVKTPVQLKVLDFCDGEKRGR